MSKTWKGFVCGVALIAVVIVPACRTRKTPPPAPAPTVTEAPPPPPVVETVAPPKDFVKETPEPPKPVVETLPADLEAANRFAQERGYLHDAFFAFDDSTLTSDAQGSLSSSANWLKQHPEYNLLVEGHCDERGTEQYNLALGDRRANSAREFLATLGIDASRIRTVSYGEERPFDPGHDETAWSKNRRAHLVLIGK